MNLIVPSACHHVCHVVAQVLGRPQRKWLDDTLDAVQEAPVKLIVSGSVVFGSPLSNDTDGPCSGELSYHLPGRSQSPSPMPTHEPSESKET